MRIPEEDIASLHIGWESKEFFYGCIVLRSNKNFARIGAHVTCELYEKTPNSICVVHDFDNHHGHSLSIQLAPFADVYVPAHLGNMDAVLNRLGNLRRFPASRNAAFHILPATCSHSHCDVSSSCKTFRYNQKRLASQGSV